MHGRADSGEWRRETAGPRGRETAGPRNSGAAQQRGPRQRTALAHPPMGAPAVAS